LNHELFIAKRLVFGKDTFHGISRPIVAISVTGIALGLAVMIIAISITTGFKKEVRNKVIGFESHIQILNYDTNTSFEMVPINENQEFLSELELFPWFRNIQVFAIKAGIIKTESEIQGVVLKGIGSDFDWTFFQNNLVEGTIFHVTDTGRTNQVLISKYLADLLQLKVEDPFSMYFVQDPPRARRFTISGIYETNLEVLDKIYLLADIGHIQRLNNWDDNKVSGFEVKIQDFKDLYPATLEVIQKVGFDLNAEGSRLKVQNIIQKYPQIFDWLNLQDINVWIILGLMLLVAGFNMISGLLILILDRTNMIGILKSVGTHNWSLRKIFLYHSGFLIARGLLWGNIIGIGLSLLQAQFEILKLDPSTYYLSSVPINFSILNILLLNAGTFLLVLIMLLLPSHLISRITPVKAIRFN